MDKSIAVVMLVTGVLAGAEAWLALGAGAAGPDAAANAPALLAIFLTSAVACLLCAWWFWRQSRRPGPRPAQPLQLFGRNATSIPGGGPPWRILFLALPVIVLAAAGVNHVRLWKVPPADVVAGQPEPEQPAPPPRQDAGAPPAPAQPMPLGEDIAALPPEQAVVPSPPAQSAAPVPAPPPEAAVPAPVPPPVTTAPLPEPEPLPVDASGHHDFVVWLDIASDGHRLLSASTDKTIKLWDIEEKRLIRDLGVHKEMARTALFMPDGIHALTAGDDGEIVLRSLADGAVLHIFSAGQNGGANKLAISPDGRRAVSGHQSGAIIVWDIEDAKALHVLTGNGWSISSAAVSPDGSRALSSSIDGELRLWDIAAGRLLRRWQGHERGAYGAVFTADGHHAFTGSGDLTIKLWDLNAGREIRRFTGHSGTVYALALSADGKRLLSASLDGSARLWDVASGDQTAMFDPGAGPIHSVAFAGDGSVLTSGGDRTIRRWPSSGGDGVVLFAGAPD